LLPHLLPLLLLLLLLPPLFPPAPFGALQLWLLQLLLVLSPCCICGQLSWR